MTLRRRLALVYIGGGLAPLLALTVIAWRVAVAMVRRQVDKHADGAARSIGVRLDERVDLLRDALATRLDAITPTTEGLRRSLSVVVTTQPVMRVILLDAKGTPLLRVTRYGVEPYDLRSAVEIETKTLRPSDREGFQGVSSAPPHTTVEVGWRPEGTLRVGTRVASEGRTLWVLLHDLAVAELMEELAPLAGGSTVVLVDRHGIMRWHTDAEHRGQLLKPRDPELYRAVGAAQTAGRIHLATLSGGTRAVALAAGPRWTVGVIALYEPVLAPLRRIGRWILVGMFGLLTISFPLLHRFSRRLAERMERLSAGAAEFAAGRWQHRVPAGDGDEVDRLGSALNRMADDLRETHERLRAQERLAVLGELSGALAHEVKNPLHSIAVSAETLQRKGEDPAVRERCQRFILEETRRLNEFLTRFLELGRPIALQRQATDLRDLVRRAVETALAGTEGRVAVREQFADNCPPVFVDSAQLLHALLNVTLNAVQAMPDGGILEVGVARHDGVATLAVSDSGAGIDPERQASLFRPFASGRTGGSGLGLAIVKRIVEAHGGSVELRSESGKGTTVTIDLPVG